MTKFRCYVFSCFDLVKRHDHAFDLLTCNVTLICFFVFVQGLGILLCSYNVVHGFAWFLTCMISAYMYEIF